MNNFYCQLVMNSTVVPSDKMPGSVQVKHENPASVKDVNNTQVLSFDK